MRVRLAAQIGGSDTDGNLVSFTSLLIALLHDRDGLESLLHIGRMYSARGTSAEQVRSWWKVLLDSPHSAETWPSSRPLLSISARNIIQSAVDRTTGLVENQDLLREYLYNVPPGHEKQMWNWGFTPDSIPTIAKILGLESNIQPPADAQHDGVVAYRQVLLTFGLVPGFDADASAILILGQVITRRRRGARKGPPPNTASTLLVALMEASTVLMPRPPELSDLRMSVQADVGDENTAYLIYRRRTYRELPPPKAMALDIGLPPPPESPALQLIKEEAQAIARRTTGQSLAATRHLLAAMIVNRDGRHNADADLVSKERGLNAESLRTQLLQTIQRSYQSDDQSAWRRLLEGARTIPIVQADTIPDDPRQHDALDLRRYADAIAALSSARGQQPPLSVAVFGAWGSGKSFFMAMVRSGVKECERLGQTDPTFLTRIVQVPFNAWHYVGGNLWASLTHSILEHLQEEVKERGNVEDFNHYMKELSIREAAAQDASERQRKAEEQEADVKAALDCAHDVVAERESIEKNQALKAQDVIKAFRDEAIGRLAPAGPPATRARWIETVGSKLKDATQYLGLTEANENLSAMLADMSQSEKALAVPIGAVEDVLEAARANAQRGGRLLAWLTHANMSMNDFILLGILTGGPFIGLVAATRWLEHGGTHIAAAYTGVASLLAPAAVTVTIVARWSQRVIAHASGIFDWLDSLRVRIDTERNQRLTVSNAELIAAQQRTAAAVTDVQRLKAEYEAAKRAVDQAKAEVQAATSPEQLKRFVAERLAAGDYLRHLGLLHTVRGDMEKLGKLLSPAGQADVIKDGETPVQRIILYIDDLDRCPPDRVVEVLEAVHLLLAFPLFVVIVGVDIRWVQQALRDRYPKQLDCGEGVASAMDYLEKVFQIPFWLPALDAAGGTRLLEAAIGPVEPETSQQPAAAGATGSAEKASGPGADPSAKGNAATLDSDRKKDSREQPKQDLAKVAPPIALAAEALMLTAAEARYLTRLVRIVGISPRRAKRFANLYRVLKASLSPAQRRRLTDPTGPGAEFRSALFLLALLTGAPKAATQLIAKLKDPLDTASAPDIPPAAAARATLEDLLAIIQPPPEEAEAFAAAKELSKSEPLEADALQNLRSWAPEVHRFAFLQ
jgi:hypothetical protein